MAKQMTLSKKEKRKNKKEDAECLKILVALFTLRFKIQNHLKKNHPVGGAIFPVLFLDDVNVLIIKLREKYPDMEPLILKACQKIYKKQKSRK